MDGPSTLSVWTLEEIEEQIALRKEWLKSGRQSYGITPASGGASRNATHLTRAEIWQELQEFVRLRNEHTGQAATRRSGPTTHHATFDGRGQAIGFGDKFS